MSAAEGGENGTEGHTEAHVTVNNLQFSNRHSIIFIISFSLSVEGNFSGQWGGVVSHTHCFAPFAILQFPLTSSPQKQTQIPLLAHSELSSPCL